MVFLICFILTVKFNFPTTALLFPHQGVIIVFYFSKLEKLGNILILLGESNAFVSYLAANFRPVSLKKFKEISKKS